MSALNRLLAASADSTDEQQQLMEQAQTQTALWQNWLLPISAANPGVTIRAMTMIFSACGKR